MSKLENNPSLHKYILGGAFIEAFIIIIVVAIFFAHGVIEKKHNTDTYTNAVKIELGNENTSEKDYPKYYFNVNDQEYICNSISQINIKADSSKNKVYYNSKNPTVCVNEFDLRSTYILCFLLLPLFAFINLIVGLFIIFNTFLKNAKIKELCRKGQLIKDIPCRIIPANVTLNNRPGYIIEIEYEGLTIKSDIKFDIDIRRNMADLLIDPLNTKNYFIDFDIEV